MTVSWEEHAGEDPRTGEQDPEQRFKLYRLCDCQTCDATGWLATSKKRTRCADCRGEGRVRELVATCNEDSLGQTIIKLGQEGNWADCPFGLLDTMGEVNQKWLVRPWLPSARNLSDAGRQLSKTRWGKGE